MSTPQEIVEAVAVLRKELDIALAHQPVEADGHFYSAFYAAREALDRVEAMVQTEDEPVTGLSRGMCTPACDHEEPLNYSGLDRSFDDHAGMGKP